MDDNLRIRAKHLWTRRMLVVLFAAILASASTYAQNSMDKERRKAIFLHNVLTFVQWSDPAPPREFEFCVEGDALLGFALDRELRNATVRETKVRMRLVDHRTDLRDCQALVFVDLEPRRVAKQLAALKGSSLITFGDSDNFLEAGGVIQLVDQNGHLQFGVNLESARSAGIQIDARLLALAKYVVKSGKVAGG